MAGAADRPIFDFTLSLDLAKALSTFADTLETECGLRQTVRDESLDAWKGKFGDNHRERAIAEDEDTRLIVEQLRDAADDWRTKWKESADEMNNVIWNEAIIDQQEYVARKKAEAEAQKAWWQKAAETVVDLQPPVLVYNWLMGGSDAAHKDVPKPKEAALPTATGFYAASNTFAHYTRENDVLVIRHVPKPPVSAVG